ncbi:MAG TPA: CoA transferase [Pseudomonadales bacterium]|jgi:formyl-CoA transferase|nr:CoA transferase [Pseudomonadales bacterium]MDP6314645.1 CoA transferase [Pseudomonadales bacterium]HJL61426.1 CoA transferase [Pseudomonadales bacterium]|tara:strand:- start:4175 stop:5374 length:1200 start_codon:yes stop_codon:yes gene_type:complete
MPQAFEGIRIIDFTQVLAGPFAVMQLALLGAEVIKVEQPETGDQTRGLMSNTRNQGMSPSFMGMNLNKKSITLNLNSAEAKEIVKKLVLEADVLVENFKAGTMQRMGLSYEELLVVKPDLIYCSVTGYGQDGPKAGEAAYDGAIQASSGMMSQTGHPTTGPTRTGFMPVDMSTALNTAFAISTSLYRKAQTGKGQYIDVAMMDTAVVMQAAQYDNYLNQGNLVGLLGNASPTKQPTANLFPTKDGFIQVTALSQSQIEKLFDALGKLEELEQPIFKTSEARVKNSDAVKKFLSEALKRNTTSYWMTNLSKAGIPVAEVRELPEVIEDPQFESREVFESIVSPLKSDESVTLVKAGYVMSKDGPTVHLNPPKLGEHTNEILGSLGYSEASISEFRQAGII